ncbi:MAG: septum formation inhibitor Maf [Synergistaceae bacterium]|jgi:septum formation protein|nr:septum formation inhibitor Maf [Synergistaceae bacterium]
MPIILASKSPRRSELLKSLGWKFEVIAPNIVENVILEEKPADMVCRLAKEKAESVYKGHKNRWIIAADTVVAIDEKKFGKPGDEVEARDMISTLQGRTHNVITGVSVISPSGSMLVSAEETEVTFRKMTENEIAVYIEQGECMDKAGAYAIQDKGVLLVEKIKGCYFNVVGLPIYLLSTMLIKLGWTLVDQWGLNHESIN